MAFRKTKEWRIVNEMKAMRIFSRADTQSFAVGLITGCILVSLTYFVISRSDISYTILKNQAGLSSRNATTVNAFAANFSQQIDVSQRSAKNCDSADSELCENTEGDEMREIFFDAKQTDTQKEIPNENSTKTSQEFQAASSTIPNLAQSVPKIDPLCDFSHRRSAICDIKGDIRVTGSNYSTVILVDRSRNESWHVKPYPRKWDEGAMKKVRSVNVTSLDPGTEEAPKCEVNHSVPAIIFSIAGYTGNFFHDTTDVLVPLFQTARRFNGKVQLVVTNYKKWWIGKYSPILKSLSDYEVIDYDTEDKVHCFEHIIVGLRSDKDLTIDASKNGYSMTDFMALMRESYGLERDRALKISESPNRRPRLLLIARGRTRKFTNLDMIIQLGEKVGFEVVLAEADFNHVGDFARIVNSCDALMGVHGAGLTNFVFLPLNSVLIQVVPFGVPDWIAGSYFGGPTKGMNLSYIEYGITVGESTLTEIYDKDDPVIMDPKSIQGLGWTKMGAVYLVKQNVRLDVNRFEPFLQQALRLLQ